jgi:hypothetical protein
MEEVTGSIPVRSTNNPFPGGGKFELAQNACQLNRSMQHHLI